MSMATCSTAAGLCTNMRASACAVTLVSCTIDTGDQGAYIRNTRSVDRVAVACGPQSLAGKASPNTRKTKNMLATAGY